MIKSIIIDDEPNAIENLLIEMNHYQQNIQVTNTFCNALEALDFLNNYSVDLVFLDIEMPFLDGFQLLNKVENKNFEVIITTAYSQYAIKAFKFNAIDYLLKPLNSIDFKDTINEVQTRFLEKNNNANKVLTVLEQISSQKKITIKTSKKICFYNPDEISHVVSDGNYSKIFLTNSDSLFVTKKLKEIDELLPKHIFIRIHNSYIINILKIKTLMISENYVILENQIKIPVSKSYKENLLNNI